MLDVSATEILDAVRRDDRKAIMAFRAALRRKLYLWTKIGVCYDEPRNLMDPETFLDRSDWIQWILTDHKRGLLEDPRGYIKTTGCTRSIPGWLAIQRPNEELDHPNEVARANAFLDAHPHLKGVDNIIAVICDSEETSTRFTGSAKAVIDLSPLVRALFPELLWPNPKRTAYGHYTDGEFSLPGRLRPTEPNAFVRAAGVETKIVGGRADFVILNDLIGDHNWQSPTAVAKRVQYLSTAPAILADRDPKSPHGGALIVEGNRWLLDDLNSAIHNRYDDWSIWRRSVFVCIEHGRSNCGRRKSDEVTKCAPAAESLWVGRYPDIDSLARLERDVKDPRVWAAQYLNDPIAAAELDETRFVPFTLEQRSFVVDGKLVTDWCVVEEPADDSAPATVIPVRSLTPHVLSIDPASSDDPDAARTVVSWIARHPQTNRRYWLDCVGDRWKPDIAIRSIADVLVAATRKLGTCPRVAVEKVAAQVYVASALRLEIDQRNRELPPAQKIQLGEIELIPRKRGEDKDGRIRDRIGLLLGQGNLALRRGLQLPRTEARHFPSGTKDALDTLAQAEDVFQRYRTSWSGDKMRELRQQRRESRLHRAGVTGVSL